MKHGYTCPMVRELWNQKINSGMSILVLGFFHSLIDSLQKHNNVKQKIILHKCKTQITLWKVLQNLFPKQMLAQKVSITTSSVLVLWNTSDPENYQVFFGILGRLSFLMQKRGIWSKSTLIQNRHERLLRIYKAVFDNCNQLEAQIRSTGWGSFFNIKTQMGACSLLNTPFQPNAVIFSQTYLV